MNEEEILVHLRLLGAQAYTAQMDESAAATGRLGVRTEELGAAMGHTRTRGFLMNQALFTVRRTIYGLTLGVIAATAGFLKWGFDFNETMKSARIALRPLIPDTQALNDQLDALFQIAKFSPFTFQDTTIAFRNMFVGMRTLGIDAHTVTQTIQAIVDSLAVAGRTSPGALNRVSVALQHVAYQGRLTGQAVNQLSRDGIPAAAILRDEFHLTGEEIHNIAKQGISTIDFLRAFNHWTSTNPAFRGAAQRQAMGSFQGLFAQFKDSMSQIMGAVERGFFNRSVGMLQRLTGFLTRASTSIKDAGSATSVLRNLFPALMPFFSILITDLHDFWVAFSRVINGIVHARGLWIALFAALQLVHGIFLILNPVLAHTSLILDVLIPLFIAYKGLLLVTAVAQWRLTTATILSTKATKDLTFAQFLMRGGLYAYYFILGRVIILQTVLNARILIGARLWVGMRLATLAANLIMVRVGITLAILNLRMAITALMMGRIGAAFMLLRTAAVGFGASLWIAMGPIAPLLVALAALAAAILLIIHYWTQFKQIVSGNVGDALGIPRGHWYSQGGIGHALGLPNSITGYKEPAHMAAGGMVTRPGLSWVGERGPELMHMPQGATVMPLNGPIGGGNRTIKIQVMINKRILGEAVADEMALMGARA